ncbi:hypothetical protein RJ639_034304 [Escallonia herrerae]|uniref:Uncharacterized protein n=1 Tax=Escallonia herrerae TaxID=1293975 RepID=A0AA89B8P7_9ASTE|nr:hypothetical protein RJ639_034304 [Escallonia herrerae]
MRTINTISGGITTRGLSGQTRKAYARKVCDTSHSLNKKMKSLSAISFSDENIRDIKIPHENPQVVTLKGIRVLKELKSNLQGLSPKPSHQALDFTRSLKKDAIEAMNGQDLDECKNTFNQAQYRSGGKSGGGGGFRSGGSGSGHCVGGGGGCGYGRHDAGDVGYRGGGYKGSRDLGWWVRALKGPLSTSAADIEELKTKDDADQESRLALSKCNSKTSSGIDSHGAPRKSKTFINLPLDSKDLSG